MPLWGGGRERGGGKWGLKRTLVVAACASRVLGCGLRGNRCCGVPKSMNPLGWVLKMLNFGKCCCWRGCGTNSNFIVREVAKVVPNRPGYYYNEHTGEIMTWAAYHQRVKTVDRELARKDGGKPLRSIVLADGRGSCYHHFDGWANCRETPWVGQGGRSYGVQMPAVRLSTHRFQLAGHPLPDPGLVFDLLFMRRPKDPSNPAAGVLFQRQRRGMNAILPFIAVIAIHDFFRSATGRGIPTDKKGGAAKGMDGAPHVGVR